MKDVKFRISETGSAQVKSKFNQLDSSLGSMKKMALGLGSAFLGLATLNKLGTFLSESIDLFQVQETAVNSLNVALGRNSTGLQEYASQLQKVTSYGDEAIIGAEALISAFVKDEDQIKKITKATLDYAYANKTDLQSSAQLITRTFASSTNALQRYGIEVEGVAGTSERLDSILGSLNDKFGGQAEGALNTYTGKITNLKNEMSDMQEGIGEKLIPVVYEFTKALRDTLVWFEEADKWIYKLGVDFRAFAGISTKNDLKNSVADEMKKRGQGQIFVDKTPVLIEQAGIIDSLNEKAKALQESLGSAKSESAIASLNKQLKATKDRLKELSELGLGDKSNNILKYLFGDLTDLTTQGSKNQFSFESVFDKAKKPITSKAKETENFVPFEAIKTDWAIMTEYFGDNMFSTLQSYSYEIWEGFFGEANSFIEKFAEKIGTDLLSRAGTGLFDSLLGLVPGGGFLGGVVDFLGLRKESSQTTNSNFSSNVLVQIGNEQLQKANTQIIPSVMAQMQRRRLLY